MGWCITLCRFLNCKSTSTTPSFPVGWGGFQLAYIWCTVCSAACRDAVLVIVAHHFLVARVASKGCRELSWNNLVPAPVRVVDVLWVQAGNFVVLCPISVAVEQKCGGYNTHCLFQSWLFLKQQWLFQIWFVPKLSFWDSTPASQRQFLWHRWLVSTPRRNTSVTESSGWYQCKSRGKQLWLPAWEGSCFCPEEKQGLNMAHEEWLLLVSVSPGVLPWQQADGFWNEVVWLNPALSLQVEGRSLRWTTLDLAYWDSGTVRYWLLCHSTSL